MKSVRSALIWLLLLAVPMQGLAAGAMLFCGAAHTGLSAGASFVHGSGHDHSLHQHSALQAASDDQEPADGAALPLSDVSGGSCSVCASCCSGVALITSAMHRNAANFYGTPTFAPYDPGPHHAASGIERPPRLRLA